MSSLWSKTSTAVANGYGMNFGKIGLPNPFYKPLPLGIHPELLMDPPYAHRPVRGGKKLPKLPPSLSVVQALKKAKKGKLRVKGAGKSYDSAALRGGDNFFATLLESLGGTAMNAIKRLAMETGASITELLADPKALIQKLMVFAPRAVAAVKRVFGLGGKKKKKYDYDGEDEEEEDMRRFKLWQKKHRTGLSSGKNYRLYRKELERQRKLEQLRRKQRIPVYDDDDEDDGYVLEDEEIITPRKRKPSKYDYDYDNNYKDQSHSSGVGG